MRLRNLLEMIRIQSPNTPDGILVFYLNSAFRQFCEETRYIRKHVNLLRIEVVTDQDETISISTGGDTLAFVSGEMGIFPMPPDLLQVISIRLLDANGLEVDTLAYQYELLDGNIAVTYLNTLVETSISGVTSIDLYYVAYPPRLDSAQIDAQLPISETFGFALYHKTMEMLLSGKNPYHTQEYHRLKLRALKQANNEGQYGGYNIQPATF